MASSTARLWRPNSAATAAISASVGRYSPIQARPPGQRLKGLLEAVGLCAPDPSTYTALSMMVTGGGGRGEGEGEREGAFIVQSCEAPLPGSDRGERGKWGGGGVGEEGQPADQRFRPVRDVRMKRQDGFRPDHPFDPEDRAQGCLQVVGILGHHPAPDSPRPEISWTSRTCGIRRKAPTTPSSSRWRPRSSRKRRRRTPPLQGRFPGRRRAAGRNADPADARLRGVAGNAQFVAQFADLDPRITDQFQQDFQVRVVQAVQIITPVHFS